MKITSSKRDDILRERNEYLAQKAENERMIAEESRKFSEAESDVFGPVEEYMKSQLSHYSVLSFDVMARRSDYYGKGKGLSIRIKCNEDRLHDQDSALSWDFEVKLDKDLNIIKETGSWSGLQATTPAQLKSLRQSVQAIEWLNDVDWVQVLDKELPRYEDYFKTAMMKDRSAEFNQRLQEVSLEDFVGTDTWIKIKTWPSAPYTGNYLWIRLIRDSGSQYTCKLMGDWSGANWDRLNENQRAEWLSNDYTQRVRKSSIHPVMKDGDLVTQVFEI